MTPMALYWHFRSKDELLDGLAERVWSEIDIDVDAAAPWPDQLRGLLESLLRVLRAHPAAPALLLHKETQNECFLRATETTLDVLRNAGFDPRYASEIARNALWTGITLVMSEAGITSLDADDRTELQREEAGRVRDAADRAVPEAGGVRRADDRLRRSRLPLRARDRRVHRRRAGDGGQVQAVGRRPP